MLIDVTIDVTMIDVTVDVAVDVTIDVTMIEVRIDVAVDVTIDVTMIDVTIETDARTRVRWQVLLRPVFKLKQQIRNMERASREAKASAH